MITVTNNVGAGLAEADDVFVTDTLPAGVFLTGPPSVTSGAGFVTSTACTGVAGGTSFTCDLGTFDNGGVVEITVPVRVESISGTSITNTASITTSSFDPVPGNNDNSGSVTVNVSSLAGTVYRDFDDSATPTASGQDLPEDTGVAGINHDPDRQRIRRRADHANGRHGRGRQTISLPDCRKAPTRSPAAR